MSRVPAIGVADVLSSLATDTDYVRGKLADYANDLISLGVDGLRLDASKRESCLRIRADHELT